MPAYRHLLEAEAVLRRGCFAFWTSRPSPPSYSSRNRCGRCHRRFPTTPPLFPTNSEDGPNFSRGHGTFTSKERGKREERTHGKTCTAFFKSWFRYLYSRNIEFYRNKWYAHNNCLILNCKTSKFESRFQTNYCYTFTVKFYILQWTYLNTYGIELSKPEPYFVWGILERESWKALVVEMNRISGVIETRLVISIVLTLHIHEL